MRIGSLCSRYLVIIICVILTAVPVLYAAEDKNSFESDLGIRLENDYSNADMLSSKTGEVFKGVVVDPSKMGGCQPGNNIQLTNIGDDRWQVKNLTNMQSFIATVVSENQSLRIVKAESTPTLSQKVDRIRSNSVMIKLGAYIPDNDIEEMDSGFHSQITYNRYINRNFAIEIGGGGFFSSAEAVFKNNSNDQRRISGDLYTYHFNLNFKMIWPFQSAEIYAGVGPGIYFLFADVDDGIFQIDDSDTIIGGQVVAGINYDINKLVFLGLEGQYILTDDAEFGDGGYSKSFDLNGYTISGVIGFRF